MGESDLISLVLLASPVVQAVMALLLIMSVVAWAIAFERSSYLRRNLRITKEFENSFWNIHDLGVLYQETSHQHNLVEGVERIFVNGFAEYQKLHDKIELNRNDLLNAVERTMRITFSQEVEKVEKRISVLATIGSSAPYIGLFGTVWGVMHAFQSLGNVQNATLASVAPGISEALIATAIGLFAAIPAVIAYNRLSHRADQLVTRYENFAESFLITLQRNERLNQIEPSNKAQPANINVNSAIG